VQGVVIATRPSLADQVEPDCRAAAPATSTRHGIVLTDTGPAFLAEARAVLSRARCAAQVLRELAGLSITAIK